MIVVLAFGACGLFDPDTRTCPTNLETFCEYEFGGECPTFDEIVSMSCDGYHFDPTGSGDDRVESDESEYQGCRSVVVRCDAETEEDDAQTSVHFYEDGTVGMVGIWWPNEDRCTAEAGFGEYLACQ